MINRRCLIKLALVLSSTCAIAQQSCPNGFRIDGTIADSTGSVIARAQVTSAEGQTATTDETGSFTLACVSGASTSITGRAEGFAPSTVEVMRPPGGVAHTNLTLPIASVDTTVQVGSDSDAADSSRGTGMRTLGIEEIKQLADDPEDLLRELQALSISGGGSPSSTLLIVDGFQNGSALPPKSSIASIRINPDLFSSEYQIPPFDGGVIEITTKPGADLFHGALFFSGSDSTFNATDAFSAGASPASKRRYGFELSGPLVRQKSGFALALEKRDVDEFNIVHAVTLDANGVQTPVQQAVSAPQRLWIASARGDWQVTQKDVAALSFSSNVNNLGNQGVGGLTLAEAGYSSVLSENDLRFTNTFAPNANVLHATHIGYSWKRLAQSPVSTAPSLQVSGFFTGGGSTAQNLNDRERDLEIDHDVVISRGRHELKVGVQSLGIFEHNYDPNTFNGAYVFGGGSAPVLNANGQPSGETTTISAIEQYRRAQYGLAGGTPTTYQVTSGTPVVPLTQWQLGLFAQDTFKLAPHFTANFGLRYVLQTSPNNFANFGPRIGFSWTPDKKETWVFRARLGIFTAAINRRYAIESQRLNGVRQQQVTIYSPSYADPLSPIAGSIKVSTVQQFPPSLGQQMTFAGYFNVEHELSHHWSVRLNFYLGSVWDIIRTRNINAPLVSSGNGIPPDPTAALQAPRPLGSSGNILEYQNAGHFSGNVISLAVDQHSYKWFGVSAYYARRTTRSDGGSGNEIPQSSYSDTGESARANWASTNRFSLTGNLNLPYHLALSTQFDAKSGTPYNITTGTDNNGDGNLTDRPSYASTPGPGVYSTRFGLLTANAINGNVPRNLGTMPFVIRLDTNLSRAFVLNPRDKEHPYTLTLNLRSENLLNHTNVTAVQTVLSSNLGQSLAAETARRVELGARFSF